MDSEGVLLRPPLPGGLDGLPQRHGNYDIYGARVRTNGTVVDATGTAFSTAPGGQFDPDLAFDGTNYLVVWSDYRAGTNA